MRHILTRTILTSFLVAPLLFAAGHANDAVAAGKNPCAAMTTPIRKKAIKDPASLMKRGEALWTSTAIGTSGSSCATCHANGAGLKKEPFPKYIRMADDIVTLDQMINFCMLNPMKGKPLAWNSQEMTAIAAYAAANAKEDAAAVNPCGMKNPCGAR